MTVIWITAAILCLLTLWALWRPVLSRSTLELESIQQRNIAIANERALEIDSAFDAGDISTEERDQARQDLEMALADELATSAELKDQFTQAPLLASLAMLILVPVLALSVYSMTSNYRASEIDLVQAAANGEAPSLEEIISQLEDAVSANPEDQRGLFLLAQSYGNLGRYGDAALRFGQLIEIAEPDADLLVSYVDNSAMANGRVFTEEMVANLDKALELNPEHISGLWLSGVAAHQLGRPEPALRRWLTLRPILTGNPEASQELEVLINEVSVELGTMRSQQIMADFSGQATDTNNKPGNAGVTVSVSLAPELLAEIDEADSVFIFARAKSGPPMPLAASRERVSALPITITLDDSMAMIPEMSLSRFEEVVVGARISKSGQATAQSGDLESELVATRNTAGDTIELIISKRRP